ncbi:MAG: acyl-CoA dehydrogenase family protein [Bacteroidota bacterium]
MNTAISIAQEAEQRKTEIEQSRNIPDDVILQLKKAGLVRRWTAKNYGGEQANIATTMKDLQAMAYHNGSLAWVSSVTNCSSLMSGFLPVQMAKKIFENPLAMVGGFAGPAGVAYAVEGGLRVSGKWSWGSGITHCSHIVGGVRLMQGDQMVGAGVVFFEPDEVEFEDNWNVVGLKGTHSIDYSTQDTIIPHGRWTSFPPTKPVIDEPLYRFSFLGALSLSVASVGLGLAQRALDEIKNIAQSKSPFGQGKPLAKRSTAQVTIAKIQGNYLAAQSLFYQTIATTEKEIQEGTCSKATKSAIRLAACHAIQLAVEVVRDAYQLAGGSSIWETNKLEELHRDIHVVSQHGMVANGNYRTVGSVLLGNSVPSFLL